MSKMELLEIRVGALQSPEAYREFLPHWPEKEYDSAYVKEIVDEVVVTEHGLEGNGIGYPTHIANSDYRVALVGNELIWSEFERVLPGSSANMKRGCFGENFVVNHPDLLPKAVCIGDEYQIGSAVFRVSGPRMPCPKVDAFLDTKGVTAIGRQTGWTGYFLMTAVAGVCRTGDEIKLLSRPYPSFTIERVMRGLWGPPAEMDNSEAFLQTLADMSCLIPRHYRETAQQRLDRLREKAST